MPKILIVTGDGAESYKDHYSNHSFQEEVWKHAVAAQTDQPLTAKEPAN